MHACMYVCIYIYILPTSGLDISSHYRGTFWCFDYDKDVQRRMYVYTLNMYVSTKKYSHIYMRKDRYICIYMYRYVYLHIYIYIRKPPK